MAKKNRLKKPKRSAPEEKGRFSSKETQDYDSQTPAFSLRFIQNGDYCFSSLDKELQAAFGEFIYRRKDLTWRQLRDIGRHGLGYEYIDTDSIKAAIPESLIPDNDKFMTFRFCGMRPVIGFRIHRTFYALWFDHNFSVYDHGS